MSWFRSLRDDFTLSPFENWGAQSESVAMASGLPDVTTNQEPAEVTEECSGKKKSKFQTFKKLFTRKKRKEPSASGDAELKASRSSDNVSKTSANNTLTRSEKDMGSGSKISLGSKAFSHDSVFVSDSSEANEALGASQDSIHGKVKSLQMQLKQAIRLGSPPSLMCVKRTEDGGTMSEDDGLPCSPPEYTTHTTQVKAQRSSFISMDSDEDQLSCTASSRAVSPLVAAPGDFSQQASPLVCLDNSAAKHKLGLRHKACNKRKPASRVELRTEGDSALEETLNNSIPESSEEAKDVCDEELKPEEQKDEEVSLLSESETKEEEKTEAEQDVSVKEDTSCEQRVPEETDSGDDEARDSPRATPEPPAGQREYLLDPPGFVYGAEDKREQSESETSQDEKQQGDDEEEDDEEQKPLQEEESSLLQEVLSSLKTPLTTLETERDVLDKDEEKEEETEEGVEEEEMEDGDKDEAGETVVVRPESTESNTSEQTFSDEQEEELEKQEVVTSFYKDAEEEIKTEEEETEEEDEEPVVEHFRQSDLVQEVEKEDTKEEEEETTLPATQSENKEEEAKETQEEVEKEVIELEPVEEALEMTEQEVYKSEEREDETEAAILEDKQKAAETKETVCDDDKGEMAVELVENREDFDFGDEKEIQDEADDVKVVSEEKELGSIQDESEDGEDTVEQDGDVDQTEEKINEEEEKMEVTEVEVESEEAEIVENDKEESEEMSQEEVTQVSDLEEVQTEEKPLSLSFTEMSSPTKSNTATTTLQINLVSPSAEKVTSPFESAPETKGEVREEVKGEKVEVKETSDEEKSEQSKADHGKVRFTIAPAWQRSLSIGDLDGTSPPSTPPVCVSDSVPGLETKEEGTKEDVEGNMEQRGSAKVELVLSPTREKTTAAKPQTPAATKTQTEDSSVGNPHNPFGVRLRKTQALQRFISEDENTEPVHEPAAQTDKPDPPLSVAPSINPPISNKPAVPKKPEVDSGGRTKRISDPAAARGGSEAPSWISVAKQKQKIYKENSAEKITVNKEEEEKKTSVSVSSAVSSKTHELSNKVSPVELLKPQAPLENVSRRPLSPPTPVPPQPLKSSPCPVPPKPQSCPRALSPPAAVAPSCTSPSPPPLSPKPNPALTSRPAPLQPVPRVSSPQDEPPWMALAKKKAKAWSEMPQIVQ